MYVLLYNYIYRFKRTNLTDSVTAMGKDVFWEVNIDIVGVEFFLFHWSSLVTKEWPEIN